MIETAPLPPVLAPPPPRPSWWPRILRVLVICLLLGGAGVGVAWYHLSRLLPGTPINPWDLLGAAGGHFFGASETRNVLVLGVDYNYTDAGMPFSKGARSDSMFLLNLSRDGRHAGMLSMPRDMLAVFPDGHQDKINAAYSSGGVPLVKGMLERFLKVPIDYYVVVRIDAATRVIDRLGGLPIAVEKDMDYDDTWGHLHIHLKQGFQTLNGMQAVGYSRYRHDEEGDRGRMRRQQQVIQALIARVKESGNLLTRLERINDLARIVRDNLETDVRGDQWVDLGRVYRGFERQNFHTAHLDGADAVVDGMAVIVPPDEGTRRRTVRAVFQGQRLTVADVRLEVLNGSGVPGAAAALRDRLQKMGYTDVSIGDAPRLSTTCLVPHSEDPDMVKILAQTAAVVGSNVAVQPFSKDDTRDATVVLGEDLRH